MLLLKNVVAVVLEVVEVGTPTHPHPYPSATDRTNRYVAEIRASPLDHSPHLDLALEQSKVPEALLASADSPVCTTASVYPVCTTVGTLQLALVDLELEV